MKKVTELSVFEKVREGGKVRVEAFGSSNTERRIPGMHWLDILELGLKPFWRGGLGECINAGVGGDTTARMLERFERDVAFYKPDLVIVTAGGNDSNPPRNISREEYRANLLTIHQKISSWGGEVIFQTYYACKLEFLSDAMAENMIFNMQQVREVARITGSALVDHFQRWERLRHQEYGLYTLLMKDNMHVNDIGNSVLGLDLLRSFGAELPSEFKETFTAGLFAQKVLDALENADQGR
ncbi:MAG: SGNH/GDSL hydrolase family protein [Lentisphaeria bacterium]|nr:SGNH/GDSL hydrolase family protein [Lentisphaeria bacterium]